MKILIIDDVSLTRTIHTKLIKKINSDIEIEQVGSYEEAVSKPLEEFNLIITDNILIKKTGIDLVNYIKKKKLKVKVIILTGWHFQDDEFKSLNIPVFYKPINTEKIKQILDFCFIQ